MSCRGVSALACALYLRKTGPQAMAVRKFCNGMLQSHDLTVRNDLGSPRLCLSALLGGLASLALSLLLSPPSAAHLALVKTGNIITLNLMSPTPEPKPCEGPPGYEPARAAHARVQVAVQRCAPG